MAYGLMLQFKNQLEQTGALEAGGLSGFPQRGTENTEISHFLPAPVAFSDWSKTGANWSSDRPAAPVPRYPLKGDIWSTSGAALRFDSWTGARRFNLATPQPSKEI